MGVVGVCGELWGALCWEHPKEAEWVCQPASQASDAQGVLLPFLYFTRVWSLEPGATIPLWEYPGEKLGAAAQQQPTPN